MQPAPDPNMPTPDIPSLPTEPLVSHWQGVPGGQSLTPIQSTIPAEPQELPPLPMKHAHPVPMAEPQEIVEFQESTDVETFYTAEVDAPHTPRQRMQRTSRIIRFTFMVIEILLLLRFFLRLVGANPSSPFGIFLFGLSDLFAAPFGSLLDNPIIGQSEIEFTTLLALIIYPVFGWIVSRTIQLVFYHELGGQQVVRKKRHTDREGF